jgi:hypothetical protein
MSAGRAFGADAAWVHSSLSVAALKLYTAHAAKFMVWPVFSPTESTLHPDLTPSGNTV